MRRRIERTIQKYVALSFISVYSVYVLIGVSCILFTKFNVVPKIPGIGIGAQYLISGIAWIVLGGAVCSFADEGAVILSSITTIMSVIAEASLFGLLLSTATGIGGTTLIVMAVLFYMGFDVIVVLLNIFEPNIRQNTWLVILTCLVCGTLVICYFGLHAPIYYIAICVLLELLSLVHLPDYTSQVHKEVQRFLSEFSCSLSVKVCIVLYQLPMLGIELSALPFMVIPKIRRELG